jgi:hypothetical protein
MGDKGESFNESFNEYQGSWNIKGGFSGGN